jgi:hypothetical protein
MKKFIKTPSANALLWEQLKGMTTREMRSGHLGQTGQGKV